MKTPKAPKPLTTKKLDAVIGKMWPLYCRPVNIMDIGKIFAAARAAYAANPCEMAIANSLIASAEKYGIET